MPARFLWPNLTGGEVIDFLARLRGRAEARKAELLERFELDPTKKAADLLLGQPAEGRLVAALLSDADLLVLDEPTSGLDPLWRRCSPTNPTGQVKGGRCC